MPKVPKVPKMPNDLNDPNDLNELAKSALEPNEPNKQNEPYVFTSTGLLFGILVIGICLSFAICYLEFPQTQLLSEWKRFFFVQTGRFGGQRRRWTVNSEPVNAYK